MLYDPCTEPFLVSKLRKILKGCFRKHIITPYTLLTKDRVSFVCEFWCLLPWGSSWELLCFHHIFFVLYKYFLSHYMKSCANIWEVFMFKKDWKLQLMGRDMGLLLYWGLNFEKFRLIIPSKINGQLHVNVIITVKPR